MPRLGGLDDYYADDEPRTVPGPVRSLVNLSRDVIRAHIAGLTDIGDAPYDLVSPVLVECTAIQLGQIELNSPHIRRDSRGLWKTHTLNEFFEVRSLYEVGEFPEPSNWRKVYLTAHEARLQKEADGKARLRRAYDAHENSKQTRRLVFDPTLNKHERAKSRALTGGFHSSSKAPQSSIAKVRDKTRSYALSFKQPIRRSRPPASPSSFSSSTPSSVSASSPSKPSSIPPPPIYRLSTAAMTSRHVLPAERFSIPKPEDTGTVRTSSSARERVVPKGVYCPPSPTEKAPKVIVDFFGKKGTAAAVTPAVSVKKTTVVHGTFHSAPPLPTAQSASRPPPSRTDLSARADHSGSYSSDTSSAPPPPLPVMGPSVEVKRALPKRREPSMFLPSKKKKYAS